MKKFTIIGILAAATCFSTQKGADEMLEKALRETESKKQAKAPEEITVIEEQTLSDVFSTIVPINCLSKMVKKVIDTYTELGHELVQ